MIGFMTQARARAGTIKPAPPTPFSSGLGYVVRHTHKALSRRLAAELSRIGIAFKHYYYLRALLETDGLSQMELSERVGVDPTTVVTVVDTLERFAVVERRADASDRRISRIHLTPGGKRLRRPLRRAIETVQAEAQRGISADDLQCFRRVAARMIENLSAEPPLR
jgi:DNA-binding MarR family transcriptional regulator